MVLFTNELKCDNSLSQFSSKAVWEIADCLHTAGIQPSESLILIASYLLFITRTDKGATFEKMLETPDYLDDAVKCIIQKDMTEPLWQQIVSATEKYEAEVFKRIVLTPNIACIGMPNRLDDMTTPESLITLTNVIAGIKPEWSVADIGCGEGSYLISTAVEYPQASYYGYEINSTARAIAAIRAALVEGAVKVVQCDAFGLVEEADGDLLPAKKFDFIFSNYPFAMRLRNVTNHPGVQKLIAKYPGLVKATSADWLFHALISELLADNGKAVCITTNGSTWNTTDREIRKQFIEEGRIEAIIALPEKMFSTTNIPTSMLVLSHGNSSVRLVDATGYYSKGRRVNTFDTGHIMAIADALLGDTEDSKLVSIEEIRRNDYVLNPGRYMGDIVTFDDGVPFETIIRNITRGAPYTASQLDQIISHTPTDMQYLMLANIQNGIIESSLPYLSEIDPKYDKYCVHTGTLILSKNGLPYKVAVAQVKEGKRILANGNLYIIDLYEDKADPYYVKAFLESEQGIAQLASITVGAALPNIGIDKLRKITIPLPPMEKQKRVAAAYRAAQDEVAVLKRKLEKAQSRLTHIFDTESEE